MKKAIWLILIVFITIVAIIYIKDSNSNSKREHNDRAIVTTTIYPLYFITKTIVGDRVEVKRLIKPGNEIHSFSPTPADLVDISHSDILITLGEQIEPWVDKLADATDTKLLKLEDKLFTISSHHSHHHHDGDKHIDKSSINPHLWLDFDNDIKIVDMISAKLSQIYPKDRDIFLKNATKLKRDFVDLKIAYTKGLENCKRDTILVGHDAFGYLEREYHFEAESIMGIFAHSRPDASKIADLTDMIKSKELRYIFVDPIESSKSVSQLATDMNLTIEPLYTVGNISLDDEKSGKDMLILLRDNLINFKKGLECR